MCASADAFLLSAPATRGDSHSRLGGNAEVVLLQLLFAIGHADEVFKVLADTRISVAATFVPTKHPRRVQPIMHSVYAGRPCQLGGGGGYNLANQVACVPQSTTPSHLRWPL